MSDQLESMKQQFETVMEEAKALAFIKILNNHPNATLPDVAAFADGCEIGDLTLGQLFHGKTPTTAKGWVKRLTGQKALAPARGRQRATTTKRGEDLNLRLQADRDIYDAKLLSFLKQKKNWKSAQEIRDACGGKDFQARASLNRLIESGKVEYKGRANGVRYKAR